MLNTRPWSPIQDAVVTYRIWMHARLEKISKVWMLMYWSVANKFHLKKSAKYVCESPPKLKGYRAVTTVTCNLYAFYFL
jgi:hypothetical protein